MNILGLISQLIGIKTLRLTMAIMNKKRLSGRRPHLPNLGKSGVIFLSFSPTMPKPEHVVSTLEINWRSNLTSYNWRHLWEPHFPEFLAWTWAIFRPSKLRQTQRALELELPSVALRNHFHQWIDRHSIYKPLKIHRHWSAHVLSHAT